jgi:hypothetical protein
MLKIKTRESIKRFTRFVFENKRENGDRFLVYKFSYNILLSLIVIVT